MYVLCTYKYLLAGILCKLPGGGAASVFTLYPLSHNWLNKVCLHFSIFWRIQQFHAQFNVAHGRQGNRMTFCLCKYKCVFVCVNTILHRKLHRKYLDDKLSAFLISVTGGTDAAKLTFCQFFFSIKNKFPTKTGNCWFIWKYQNVVLQA